MTGFLAWVLRRACIRIYSRAQIALEDTLAQPPVPREGESDATPSNSQTAPVLPGLLRHAHLRTLALADGSRAAGLRIRELQLRTRSGASIVGIDRNGDSVINPGPDEELRAGDQILLLGSIDQITAAERLLSGPQASGAAQVGP
jgi:CPA2 family monovalent cation:H+ antiporter-2